MSFANGAENVSLQVVRRPWSRSAITGELRFRSPRGVTVCSLLLRHLFATEMLKDGAKLEVVSRILGHSSIKVTVDVYRHVTTGEMHEEVERHGLGRRKSTGKR
jgi:site-specific recombinase XerD